MSQDTLIPAPGSGAQGTNELPLRNIDYLSDAPIKPIWHRAIFPPRITLNGLLISVLFAMGITLAGFMAFPLPSPLNGWAANAPQEIEYTLQLPFMLMTAIVLGPFMGPAAVLLFLATGLAVLPVFSAGGGWHYVFEPGFGYLLATLFVGSWLSRTFHKALQKTEKGSRSLRLCQKAFGSVLAVHAIGISYMLGLTLLGFIPWSDIGPWILRLSIEKAPYDLAACILLFGLVRQLRMALWLILY